MSRSLPLISSNGLDGQSRLKWDIYLTFLECKNFSSSSFLCLHCLSFMHNTHRSMGGISSRASTKVFPSYSTKMKAITQEKVLILYNPFEVNLQTDFDFFSGLILRLGKIRLTSTTTQVVKQQQIDSNWFYWLQWYHPAIRVVSAWGPQNDSHHHICGRFHGILPWKIHNCVTLTR